ncbi:hypothetical protein SESBI_01503 [Sesbania bispinosa]|nr:hypothetical protein SESBI_01503 [Sesbania bispinosa]
MIEKGKREADQRKGEGTENNITHLTENVTIDVDTPLQHQQWRSATPPPLLIHFLDSPILVLYSLVHPPFIIMS